MKQTLRFLKLVVAFTFISFGAATLWHSAMPDLAIEAVLVGAGLAILYTDLRKT